MQLERGEEWVLLETLVEPRQHRCNGGVAKAERSRSKHIADRRIHRVVVTSVRADILIKSLLSNDFWHIVPHGNDLK